MVQRAWLLIPALSIALSGCAPRNKPPVTTPSPTPAPSTTKPSVLEERQGLASYSGPGFEARVTASGAKFDKDAMVAAHPSYPFGTVVRVTNLANGRRIIVRIVDRGPTAAVQAEGVLIDLSSGAARNLGLAAKGRTKVRLEVLRWGNR